MMDKECKAAVDIIPQNDYVLCKRVVADSSEVSKNGFIYQSPQMPVYEILKMSESLSLVNSSKTMDLNVGDHIICNSTGTQIQASDDEPLWLFKLENIAAKLKD